MYINFAHFLIPKISALCSVLINPLTVYIVWNDKKLQLGPYRYLLLYFAFFNITTSVADMLVPMCVLNYRYAFSVFVSEGYFDQYSEFNQFFLAFRCSLISGAYAVLHAHFLYRFFVLFNNQFLARWFMPYGIILAVLYCLFHTVYWTIFCWFYMGGDFDRRVYIRDSMLEHHGVDVMNMTIIIAQYFEGTPQAMKKSRIGIGSLSVLSIISLVFIFHFGYKICHKLSSQSLEMSEKTKKLQTQLMKALVVQAAIPTCVSFAPCLFAWYQPVFGLDLGRWIQHAAGIAVATFPALDPLALIFFVPTFRKKFAEYFLFLKSCRTNRTTCSQQTTTSTSQPRIDK
ncbi:Protein CBR-SRJ-22 [Caenorhabditis briggsae]|uniref:Protein CBR-SRJ-22 n=1 Tax=Caenorhabditis briggsae TaxID=6238 RepID=A8XS47_CAEBR|nr:Protein CBR-SRJ-22 [Caenorhabditis briggsae]CAP35466.1 Protein CBR-SRJ-22 [Caenorhabditis briggsae]